MRTILIPIVVQQQCAPRGTTEAWDDFSLGDDVSIAWTIHVHQTKGGSSKRRNDFHGGKLGVAGCDITHAQIDRVMLSIDHCLMPIARSSLCIFRVAVCWNFTCNVFVIYQNKATDTRLEMHNCVWANFAFSERAMLQLLKWPMYGLHAAHMYSSTVWISPVIDTRLIHGRGGIVAFQCQHFFSIFAGPLSRQIEHCCFGQDEEGVSTIYVSVAFQ